MSYDTNNTASIEKNLLTLRSCGCYISIHDIVHLAEKLGFDLPFKRRALSLQSLFLEANKNAEGMKLLTLICALLEEKKEQLGYFITLYPKTEPILLPQAHAIEATKLLLQKESALHVKELP